MPHDSIGAAPLCVLCPLLGLIVPGGRGTPSFCCWSGHWRTSAGRPERTDHVSGESGLCGVVGGHSRFCSVGSADGAARRGVELLECVQNCFKLYKEWSFGAVRAIIGDRVSGEIVAVRGTGVAVKGDTVFPVNLVEYMVELLFQRLWPTIATSPTPTLDVVGLRSHRVSGETGVASIKCSWHGPKLTGVTSINTPAF